MWLDRSLIKKQAKELIKNRVLKLFGITLIIFIILNAFSAVYNITNYSNIFSTFNAVSYTHLTLPTTERV